MLMRRDMHARSSCLNAENSGDARTSHSRSPRRATTGTYPEVNIRPQARADRQSSCAASCAVDAHRNRACIFHAGGGEAVREGEV